MLHLLSLLLLCVWSAPSVPVWPTKYSVAGTFDIPYWEMTAPISLEVDSQKQRLEWFNGLDVTIIDLHANKMYEVYPRKNVFECLSASASGMSLYPILPDLSTWTYTGLDRVNGWVVEVWTNDVTQYGLSMNYTFYLNRAGFSGTPRPIQYVLQGVDVSLGSGHPDIYVWTFNKWQPDVVDSSAFSPGMSCRTDALAASVLISQKEHSRVRAAARFMASQGLPMLTGDATEHAFHRHVLQHGKFYVGGTESYARRLSIFRENTRMIDAHNARYARGLETYDMAVNHFADLTRDEMLALYAPRALRSSSSNNNNNNNEVTESRLRARAVINGTFSWMSKGAVNAVVDQGSCGSCWTFGTAAAIEGAYFVKTGKLLKVSEQQIVDCAWASWNDPNSASLGCNGGFAWFALEWVMGNGGIALESSYPYLGQDAMCMSADRSSGIRVSSYQNFSGPSDTVQALMNAPLSIAIDAGAPGSTTVPPFYFYSSGIYSNPQCGFTPDQLDHEVTLIGTVVMPDGSTGVQIKNSWSTHWGMNGLGFLSSDNQLGCGWATSPRLAII